jgi:hypothetical protein
VIGRRYGPCSIGQDSIEAQPLSDVSMSDGTWGRGFGKSHRTNECSPVGPVARVAAVT